MPPTDDVKPVDRRTFFARLALATDLPMPNMIRFHDEGGSVSIDLDSVAAGRAWAAETGSEHPYEYDNTNGRRYLHAASEDWHGFKVSAHADEQIAPDGGLDEADRVALEAVVKAPPACVHAGDGEHDCDDPTAEATCRYGE